MTSTNEFEIESKRLFAAPADEVFEAFRDPSKLEKWWGPRGFSSSFREFDFCEGGYWRFTLHGPDGADYPNEVQFLDISPGSRILFQHIEPQHNFRMDMRFVDEHGQTIVTWRMTFESPIPPDVRQFILGANQENFDRLAAVLGLPGPHADDVA